MERPRFLVLTEPIPASELDNLLGRFVVDCFSPLDISAPKSGKSVGEQYKLDPILSEDVAVILKLCKERSAGTRLQSILELAASRGWNQELRMESSKIRTYRLKSHNCVFEDIISDEVRLKEVKALFNYSKGGFLRTRRQLFMITGVKVISDSSYSLGQTVDNSQDVTVTIPVSQAINTVAPGLGVVVNFVDPEVSGSHKNQSSATQSFKTIQDQIFAVEYRTITKPLLVKYSKKWKPSFGSVKRFDWGNAMMGDDEDGVEVLKRLDSQDIEKDSKVLTMEDGDYDLLIPDS